MWILTFKMVISISEDHWRYSKRLLTQHYWIPFITLFLFCWSSQLGELSGEWFSFYFFLGKKLSFAIIHLILSYLNPKNKRYLSIHLLWNFSFLLSDLKLIYFIYLLFINEMHFPGWSSTIMRFIKNLSKIQTKTLKLFLAKTRCWEKEFVQFIRNHQRRKSPEPRSQLEQ